MTNLTRAATAAALLLIGATASAQLVDPDQQADNEANRPAAPTGPEPPKVDTLNERSPILRYAVLFLVAGAAVGVTVLPGKRTHED